MTSKLNTTAIREMAAAHANEKLRRNEKPGAVLTGTVPGLCDEVDRLRAIVASVVDLHAKDYETEADEVWGTNAVCGGCQHSWPCETSVAIGGDA